MKLSLGRVAEFVHASGEFDQHAVAAGYSIDSRTVEPGDLFFAVRGESLDGHDYVEKALALGAVAAVVRKDSLARFAVKTRLLTVDDTLVALQNLGAAVRRVWGKTVVGVTGSAGKTTTKEAVAHVLGAKLRVLKSAGNLNNHFGMPLQLLRLESGYDIAVIEMGMSRTGEIAALARLAKPDVGLVTNVAPVHLEFFESIAGIARAKYELIESLPSNGTAVLNADDEYVAQFGRDYRGRVLTYGIRRNADVRAENVESLGEQGSAFDLVTDGFSDRVTIALLGEHNVLNAVAAVAVALSQGFTPSEAMSRLASLVPAEKRGEILKVGGATVINDCYNSNPKALKAMVDALASVTAKRHIVVAGEMLELGTLAPELHRDAGSHMASRKVDIVVGVRGLAEHTVQGAIEGGATGVFMATPEDAGEWLAREVKPDDAVLLKASRGVKLERALEKWKEVLGAGC